MALFDREALAELQAQEQAWEATRAQGLERFPERYTEFSTMSGVPVQGVYTPLDIAGTEYSAAAGLPGEYPFTRGVHATGHRGKLWTMRMFAGFGSAEETNARFKYLLANGQTGLSIAFDMPTLYGYDTDAPEAVGEFGLCGVAVGHRRDPAELRPREAPRDTGHGARPVRRALVDAPPEQRGDSARQSTP